MASSSDWLTEVLERPLGDTPSPLGWLHDFGHTDDAGFVEGMPFDREASQEPQVAPEASSILHTPPKSLDADTGDALEDVLRKALAQSEAEEAPRQEVEHEVDTESASQPDPIAEAYAKGEEAGRQVALAQQEVLAAQKLGLRQTFRALDQAAMDALAAELAETVITLCSQSLADFVPTPDTLKTRCLEAAKRLGSGAEGATLYLHPDDLALIENREFGAWNIMGDPAAERGGLRFETKDGSISDTPSDWCRAIATAIRGQGTL